MNNDLVVFLMVRFLHFDAIAECTYKKIEMFEDIIMIIFQNTCIGNTLVY